MNERIRQLRKLLGLTLEEFGAKVGVTKQTVSRIENGVNAVTDQMFKSICREWNVNEEWLRTGEGEMFVEMTRDEQIASFIGSIQANVDDSFKKRFISMLSTLDEPEWELLEKMALKLYKKD